MAKAEFTIKTVHGLHARPASKFVKEASAFESDIKLIFGEKEINAKSILAVTSLGATKGDEITIKATGVDEQQAIDVLVDLLEKLDE